MSDYDRYDFSNKQGYDPNKEPDKDEKSKKRNIRGAFYNNTFIAIISIIAAVFIWFGITMSETGGPSMKTISDIPITVELSSDFQAEGLKIFNMSQETADVTVTGNSFVTGKLTAKDFMVTASYAPSSTKVSGTGIRVEKVSLKAQKSSDLADYSIDSINPEEITLEIDKAKEATFAIDSEIKYTTSDSGIIALEPILSETSVTINGPESSVNKISRVAIVYDLDTPLKQEQVFTAGLTLYNQDGNPIKDTSGMYLEMSVENIEVTIPVYSKKTVPLEVNIINAPDGFAESRIQVKPETIDIAGTEEELSKINQITLETPVDFSKVTFSENKLELDIPVPNGIRNLSAVEKASIEINLNGFKSTKLTTSNINIANPPAGKSVTAVTQSITVEIIGSEAQINKLTGEDIYCTVDMTGRGDQLGTMDLPVSVMISGANTCWAYGKYNISVNIADSKDVTIEATSPDANAQRASEIISDVDD